jgi:hypothetical protein
MLAAVPIMASAQFPPPPPPPGSPPPASAPPPAAFPPAPGAPPVRDRWPDPPKPADSPRSQTRPPAAAPQRPAAQTQPAPNADTAVAPASKPKPRPRVAAAPATVVTCDGVFEKGSSHLKLAMKYDSRNVIYADVDGAKGNKIKASVLYPSDPRRRLEVIWMNETARTQLLVISINGQSRWSGPNGLKLGLPLAALEKANGRPFKVSGFGADGLASVLGWEGGALGTVTGGCKLGVQVRLDQRAPEAARNAVAQAKELMSNDAALKPVKPTVAEILIGY